MLLRSPYRRTGAFHALFALPYARRGYAVVLQSVRGTFGSDGEFTPVVNEEHDGQDTVAWLREQPGDARRADEPRDRALRGGGVLDHPAGRLRRRSGRQPAGGHLAAIR